MTAWIGVGGVVIGFALNAAFEWARQRSTDQRADVVWRREKYVDAVAEFVHVAREMTTASSSVSRAIFSQENAARNGDAQIVAYTDETLRSAYARHDPLVAAMSRLRARVQIYAPADVRERADSVWSAILNESSFPDVRGIPKFESAVNTALEDLLSAVQEKLPNERRSA